MCTDVPYEDIDHGSPRYRLIVVGILIVTSVLHHEARVSDR